MPVKLLEPLDSPLFYGTHLDFIRGRSLGEVVVYWSEWWLRKMCAWLKQRYGPLQSEVSYYVVDRDKNEKNKQLRFHLWIGKTSVSVVLLA